MSFSNFSKILLPTVFKRVALFPLLAMAFVLSSYSGTTHASNWNAACTGAVLSCGGSAIKGGATAVACIAAAVEGGVNVGADYACTSAAAGIVATGGSVGCLVAMRSCANNAQAEADKWTAYKGKRPRWIKRKTHKTQCVNETTPKGIKGYWHSNSTEYMAAVKLQCGHDTAPSAGETSGNKYYTTYTCPSGYPLLKGLKIKSGSLVDGIRPICGDVQNHSNTKLAPWWMGGPGGGESTLECADGYFVKQIEVTSTRRGTKNMNAIRIKCGG